MSKSGGKQRSGRHHGGNKQLEAQLKSEDYGTLEKMLGKFSTGETFLDRFEGFVQRLIQHSDGVSGSFL
jgi:hypothetical protein